MRASLIAGVVLSLATLSLTACNKHEEHAHSEHQNIVVTTAKVQDVTITQQYVCQIRSGRNIEVQPLQEGYLEKIELKEGQAVKEGDVLFKILPTLYKRRMEAEQAKANVARIKYEQSQGLAKKGVVSPIDVQLAEAEYNEAYARARQAEAEVDFTVVKAKFDGIIDRLYKQEGSYVDKKDVLTTLSDNSTMWVYFNVPELRYIEYRSREKAHNVSQLTLADSRVELYLADGSKFDHPGTGTVVVEGLVNYETGNYKFRADFPNPERLLRHGQTGTVRILRTAHNAVVIPQRATFETLDKQYVWVVGEDKVVHRRLITVAHELEDKFVVASGLDVKDKFILEGIRQVHEGDKLEEFEFENPDTALKHQKYHAE
jgi:membrane fusion protein (multidrug efflux system)